jgi:superfamily II DNA helicase RecQ
VLGYSRDARQLEPGPEKLRESKHAYQAELILELFDLHVIDYRFENLLRTCREHLGKEERAIADTIAVRKQDFSGELIPVTKKFREQLSSLLANPELPAENTLLQERVRKAVAYFTGKLNELNQFLRDTVFDTDNKATQKALNESLEKLQKEVFIRLTCLEATRNGFGTLSLLRAKSDADLDFRPPAKTKIRTQQSLPGEIPNPELFQLLKDWRKKLADDLQVPVYRILPQKSIHELVIKLPVNTNALKSITGIGPAKLKQYGSDILSLIMEYVNKEQ